MSFAEKVTGRLEEFVELVESGKAIRCTRLRIVETPDGQMVISEEGYWLAEPAKEDAKE